MVVPHADPRLVAAHVIDTVRNGLPARVGREIVDAHRLRRALRLPFAPAIRSQPGLPMKPGRAGTIEVADQFLLLGIDRDDRLLTLQEAVCGRIDVLKLGVAVGVRGPFPAFARRLQTVTQVVEHAADGCRADGPARRGQRRRELCATLARPPQGRRRVTARERIDQRLQGIPAVGLPPQVRASRARAANAPDRWAAPRQFASAFAHGHARQPGRRRHDGIAAVPDGQRLGRRPHPPVVRRLRSSNTGAMAAYLATTTASSFRSRCTRTSRSDTEQRWNLYFGQCPNSTILPVLYSCVTYPVSVTTPSSIQPFT